ncbi:MAG: 3-oxoacyl-ACP reductase FabG [Desulfobacteraceae bacterium]|nr:MAG: 3-oxoacyl-ACP reductase FabG [Desulfobacteraceae bacterium]
MISSNGNRKHLNSQDRPVAIITGGGTGIGAACSRALSQNGFYVGIHFRNSRESAHQVLSEIHGNGCLLQADMNDIDQVERMVGVIQEKAGRVDVLVNNAGMCINEPMVRMKMDSFDSQRSVLRGVWYLTKRVLRVFMIKTSSGRIINISSVVGHTGNAGQIPYTMEKAGMDAMTRSLSKELWGRNILVNSVSPGFIETDMTKDLSEEIRQQIVRQVPLGRMGKPEEVADVVSFLAGSGTYITGSVIHVNGGMYCG